MRSDDEQVNEIEELREQLAAANALLADAIPANVCKAPWLTRRDEHFAACGFNPVKTAHLAAQPATAPARDEAEQRVLDAVKWHYERTPGELPENVWNAYAALARRESKRG